MELNNRVADFVRRGYKVVDRGKHHSNYVETSRIVYWATVVKI